MRGAIALAFVCAGGFSCKEQEGQRPAVARPPLSVSYGDCSEGAGTRAASTEMSAGGGNDAGAIANVEDSAASDQPLGVLVGDSIVEMRGAGLGAVACDQAATAGFGGAGGEIGSGSPLGDIGQISGDLPTQCGPYYDLGGRSASPTKASPVVKQGHVQVRGNLDKNIVRRYLRRSMIRMRHCYEQRLTSKPRLAGTVKFEWVISADGVPLAVKVKGIGDPALDSCLAKAIRAIHYPKPAGGGLVQVSYSLTLAPPPRTRGAKVARPRRAAPIDAGVVDAAPEPAVSAAPMVSAASTDAAPVQVTSPLTSISEQIEDCLHQSSDGLSGGELAVNLTVDKDGAVTAASATGSDDLALLTCIGDRAMTLTYPPSDRPARIYRCPIAFERSVQERSR